MTEVTKPMELQKGVYALETIEDQMKYASFLIGKKLVSDTFKDPAQLMIAIQLCKDLDLPNSCLKDFYVINGRPTIYGDTFVALALGSGVIQEHSVAFYDQEGNEITVPKKGVRSFSCVVTGRRKGSTLNSSVSYSMDDKENSRNNNPNFDKHRNDMLFRRAMGRFIKWICADAIRGIEMADYAEEAIPDRTDSAGKLLVNIQESIGEDFPIPPEEKQIGPLYRVQNAKFRGKQLFEIPITELEEYLETLKSRTTSQKAWERELIQVLTAYLENIDSYREQILELMSEEK